MMRFYLKKKTKKITNRLQVVTFDEYYQQTVQSASGLLTHKFVHFTIEIFGTSVDSLSLKHTLTRGIVEEAREKERAHRTHTLLLIYS